MSDNIRHAARLLKNVESPFFIAVHSAVGLLCRGVNDLELVVGWMILATRRTAQ